MTRVGLLGDGAAAARDVVRDAGGDPVVGEDALSTGVDALATLGEPALQDALHANVAAPVLPVDAGREYGGVDRNDLSEALGALVNGKYDVHDRRTLVVSTGDEERRALADVLLVTTEAAQISEYAIDTGEERIDEVRADGVVAATPSGSRGYAGDAGAPELSRGAGVLAVVPIAPFRVERVRWALEPPLSVTVLRESADVTLLVDGRDCGLAVPHQPVTLEWGDPFPVAVVGATDGNWPVE